MEVIRKGYETWRDYIMEMNKINEEFEDLQELKRIAKKLKKNVNEQELVRLREMGYSNEEIILEGFIKKF